MPLWCWSNPGKLVEYPLSRVRSQPLKQQSKSLTEPLILEFTIGEFLIEPRVS